MRPTGGNQLRRRLLWSAVIGTAALLAGGPATATAQCPGCDEYTFEIPGREGDREVAPSEPEEPVAPATEPTVPTAPAPAPVTEPVAPAEPAPADSAPLVTEPETQPSGKGGGEKGEKLDLSALHETGPVKVGRSVPASAVEPSAVSPAVLFAVLAAVTAAGAALGLRRRFGSG
jgi:hypothetical protein